VVNHISPSLIMSWSGLSAHLLFDLSGARGPSFFSGAWSFLVNSRGEFKEALHGYFGLFFNGCGGLLINMCRGV